MNDKDITETTRLFLEYIANNRKCNIFSVITEEWEIANNAIVECWELLKINIGYLKQINFEEGKKELKKLIVAIQHEIKNNNFSVHFAPCKEDAISQVYYILEEWFFNCD